MNNLRIAKPIEGEYPAYAKMYMDILPDDELIIQHLENNFHKVKSYISSLPYEKLEFRYEENKWTIKEILVHIIDDERIYAYRALRIARNDKTSLPGFEQDDYVPYSRANERALEDIFEEYESVRKASITLFKSFNQEDLMRIGVANGNPVSVRALIYHMAGHELHHLKIISERYI